MLSHIIRVKAGAIFSGTTERKKGTEAIKQALKQIKGNCENTNITCKTCFLVGDDDDDPRAFMTPEELF
jgi:hypothetical protein